MRAALSLVLSSEQGELVPCSMLSCTQLHAANKTRHASSSLALDQDVINALETLEALASPHLTLARRRIRRLKVRVAKRHMAKGVYRKKPVVLKTSISGYTVSRKKRCGTSACEQVSD
jgi:hypothetical protein